MQQLPSRLNWSSQRWRFIFCMNHDSTESLSGGLVFAFNGMANLFAVQYAEIQLKKIQLLIIAEVQYISFCKRAKFCNMKQFPPTLHYQQKQRVCPFRKAFSDHVETAQFPVPFFHQQCKKHITNGIMQKHTTKCIMEAGIAGSLLLHHSEKYLKCHDLIKQASAKRIFKIL